MTSRGSFALIISMTHASSTRFGFIDFDVVGQLPKKFIKLTCHPLTQRGRDTSSSSEISMTENAPN